MTNIVTIDTRPSIVNLIGYAGDSLHFYVVVDAATMGDRTLVAQIREAREDLNPDATFDITATPTVEMPDMWMVSLPASVTRSLTPGQAYFGYWDLQLADESGMADPVNTLVQGSIAIHPDVTRV